MGNIPPHHQVNDRGVVTPEMALRLEMTFGKPNAAHWLRLQNAYDLWQARQHCADIHVTPVVDWKVGRVSCAGCVLPVCGPTPATCPIRPVHSSAIAPAMAAAPRPGRPASKKSSPVHNSPWVTGSICGPDAADRPLADTNKNKDLVVAFRKKNDDG
jgi:hypothetical protein